MNTKLKINEVYVENAKVYITENVRLYISYMGMPRPQRICSNPLFLK
jgi:hypothetical protein